MLAKIWSKLDFSTFTLYFVSKCLLLVNDDIETHHKFVLKLLRTTIFSKECFWEMRRK